ncbi:MAG: winged helix-turn-helix transcriptional regulator [Actinomycetia bacterium]|nr:winged helix-turn-helix transcriptional regulator [Actinomycetes bacterium]
MSASQGPPSKAGRQELDDGLGNVLFDVWLVSRATIALIDEVVRPSGLDADEFAVYSVLASGDGMTPSELAHWMAAPPTTVSSYVKRFERRGHVRRVANPGDGRSYRVELTESGRLAHRSAGDLFAPVLQQVTERIGEQADETHLSLRALHEVVDSLDRPVQGSALGQDPAPTGPGPADG